MVRCMIVDDEVNARNGLAEYVAEVPFLKLIASFDNPMKALAVMDQVDLMLLDVQMPGINGISFLKSLKNPPLVIMTTAYPEFALQGYELEVLDYLVKPIAFDRFLTAVNKAQAQLQARSKIKYEDFIFVKTDKGFERIEHSDILYIEGLQNYVIVQCTNRQVILYTTIKGIESFLNPEIFLRVQKSYIVNTSKVSRLYKDDLIINEKPIPVSKKNRDEILEKLFKGRAFKRG